MRSTTHEDVEPAWEPFTTPEPAGAQWREADIVEDYDSERELTPPAFGGSHEDIVRFDD